MIHPWADFNQLDTHHYPAYQTGTGRLANGYNVFMPTEFLHGQYDKGLGAGLEDYWNNYTSNPLFAGGFLWTFIDEAVSRSDKGGILGGKRKVAFIQFVKYGHLSNSKIYLSLPLSTENLW